MNEGDKIMDQNKVLVEVNGNKITQQDVYAFLNGLGQQAAMQFQSPDGMKQIADELANQELLYLDAVEKGLDEEEDFRAEMENMKKNVLKQYAMHKLFHDISVTEEEIKDYYEEHKEQFQTPETIRASHILVEDEKEAEKIFGEIEEGKSFEDAAKEYSTCPSKENGGDLGEFPRGSMVPEFEKAAFEMELDKVSKPVETQFGYHIIKVVSKKEKVVNSLDEVKDKVTEQITGLKQQERYLDTTQDLKKKYEVKTYY